MTGRVNAGGLTLRALGAAIEKPLADRGFFRNPQITVSVEIDESQRIFIVGEVRTQGTYPPSGDLQLVEAIATAGSTPPSMVRNCAWPRRPEVVPTRC